MYTSPVPLRLFVVTGSSEFQFDRLVRACVDIHEAANGELRTTIQFGASAKPPALPYLDCVEFVDSNAYRQFFAKSDVLVGHAGLGLILDLLRTGLPAILIPRREQLAEHIDDHQMQIARAIDIERIEVTADIIPNLTMARLHELARGGRRPAVALGNPKLTAAIGEALGREW